MADTNPVAQVAAVHPASRGPRGRRIAFVALVAAVIAAGTLVSAPAPASAASAKVVIIVGPAGSSTAKYIDSARRYAAQARSYGAAVTEIYSPNATWAKVKGAAQGANLLVYLGHGNGWPSPHGPWDPKRKDGVGLNPYAGSGNTRTSYYGEWWIRTYIKLAPGAVVILNRLCYASGNSEPGYADPSRTTARQRVDNYGAGFLAAGAQAVFANGTASASPIIYGLFKTTRTMEQIFWSDPAATRTYAGSFTSTRTRGAVGIVDPYRPGKYYHSVIGALSAKAAAWG